MLPEFLIDPAAPCPAVVSDVRLGCGGCTLVEDSRLEWDAAGGDCRRRRSRWRRGRAAAAAATTRNSQHRQGNREAHPRDYTGRRSIARERSVFLPCERAHHGVADYEELARQTAVVVKSCAAEVVNCSADH